MPLTDQEILDRVEGQTVPTAFMATLAVHSDLVAVRWMVAPGPASCRAG